MKNLRDKILDSSQPVIFYELLPPNTQETAHLDAYIECAIDLLTSSRIKIDAVNIPEIREEEYKATEHTETYVPKMDPGAFATMLEQAAFQHIEVVLNHCTVYEPLDVQKQWMELVTKRYKINVLILVGGGSSQITYPGPSVLEMSDYIQTHYQRDFFCGGITIQTRRSRDKEKDEPFRLVSKCQHHLEFFTSQIIYEPVSIKLLLRDYANICLQQGIAPKRIFLSFAPISKKKDLDFLRWLGVSIPKTVEHELFKADIGIGWRSAKIAVNILQEILHFMQEENIQVPLGLNIEHITKHNFELSFEFIIRLGELYGNHMALVSLSKSK